MLRIDALKVSSFVFCLLAALFFSPALLAEPNADAEAPIDQASACNRALLPAAALLGGDFATIPLAGECTATADCENGSQVFCQASDPSVTCQAVDQNCSNGTEGFVQCGTTRIDCPSCGTCFDPRPRCVSGRACGCDADCGPATCINGSCNCDA